MRSIQIELHEEHLDALQRCFLYYPFLRLEDPMAQEIARIKYKELADSAPWYLFPKNIPSSKITFLISVLNVSVTFGVLIGTGQTFYNK